ncbi:hypothetical protein K469DRAFT_767285, partial [Zopfia rhizophila CBS 207.26]
MSVLDGFITQPDLPVSNKLKMFYEKEAMMKYTTSTTKEKAHATKQIKWKTHKPAWKSRDTSQDDEMSDADDTRCFICDSTQHWKTDCPYAEEVKRYAIKLRLRDEKPAKAKRPSKPSKDSRKGRKPVAGIRKHGHTAGSEDDATGSMHLSKEELSKASPTHWILDNGASSPMTDQLHLFRKLRKIPKVIIQVGGSELYSTQKGTALVTAMGGSKAYVRNVYYVKDLGVSLLSGRKLCKLSPGNIHGSFDEISSSLYYKEKEILKAV